MLKAELHAHTADDQYDRIPHTATELIDHAARLGYRVLSITLHDRCFDPAPLAAYALEREIVLLPGLERTIQGKHVLLIDFPSEAIEVESFDDVAALKKRHAGVVIAPHPFYPIPSALGSLLDRHVALFDAVEVSAMYVPALDFNRRAAAWAESNRKPLVGNGDIHRLEQLGTTWSLIDAPPDARAICAAIRAGHVTVETTPLGYFQAARVFADMTWGGLVGRLSRRDEKSRHP